MHRTHFYENVCAVRDLILLILTMKMYAVPRGSTSFLKKNIVLGKFTVRLYSRSNPTLSGFILPQPHWSLSELKILVKSEKVIDDILLDKLAKMSCICLDSASLKVSRQDIKDDINTILNCSKILKVTFNRHIFPDDRFYTFLKR